MLLGSPSRIWRGPREGYRLCNNHDSKVCVCEREREREREREKYDRRRVREKDISYVVIRGLQRRVRAYEIIIEKTERERDAPNIMMIESKGGKEG